MAARLWALAWAAPCSAIGLLLGWPLMLAGRGHWRRVDHTLEISAWPPEALAPVGTAAARAAWLHRLPFHAITLGHVVLGVSPEALARLRPHERVHVRQYERWGALFLLAYPMASLLAWWRGGCAYRDNWFEREAYGTAEEMPRPGASAPCRPAPLRSQLTGTLAPRPLGMAGLFREDGQGPERRRHQDTADELQATAGGPHLRP